MSEIALHRINSFAPVAQQADVSPEEPILVLTGSQLQEIITKAVLPLQTELQDQKDTIALLGEKMATLEATQDLHAENQFIQLQLINNLRDAIHKEPQPLQKDRGEILRALLAANNGKMLAKEARRKMRLSEQLFSMLISSMEEYIEIKPLHSDKRKNLLILK